jgi:hypothetical protein
MALAGRSGLRADVADRWNESLDCPVTAHPTKIIALFFNSILIS